MYAEGLMDLMEMIMTLPFIPDVKEKLENIENKAKTRYLPVFEKVSVLLFRFLTNQTDPNWGCIKMYCNLIAHLLNLPGSEWNRVPGGRENKHGWCAAAWMHPDAGGEVLWDFCILSQHKGDFLIYFFYPHMLLTVVMQRKHNLTLPLFLLFRSLSRAGWQEKMPSRIS